jgi:hypothetical protein
MAPLSALNEHTVCGDGGTERAGGCSLSGLCWVLRLAIRSVRSPRDRFEPPARCSRICSRDLLRGTGTRGDRRRDGTAASVLLSGLIAPGMPPATTTSAQFRSRCATAASPPGSCPRGGGHRGQASPSGRGGANGATVCEGHPHRPCHRRAIHSGLERSRADNHGQPRSSLDLRHSLSSQVAILPDLALGARGRSRALMRRFTYR